MKLSKERSFAQRKEVQNILHDLIYSNAFFLNSLATALQHNFIRCLQWSVDGRCVCVDKSQSLKEFEFYLNLSRPGVSLECYNKLVARLQENQFQLASYWNLYENKICFYFLPSFNRATYSINVQLLNPVNNKYQCLVGVNNSAAHFNRNCIGHDLRNRSASLDFFPNQYDRSAEVAAVFQGCAGFGVKCSPEKIVQPQATFSDWNGIKLVPLSFFSRVTSGAQNSASSETSFEDNDDKLKGLFDNDDEYVAESTSSDEEHGTEESNQAKKQKLIQSQSTQKKILELFFNPRQKKQSYVSSWLDSCHFEAVRNIDEWNSAVLMPSGRKKNKHFKSTARENFAVENRHLVDVFGNAYINWKQKRDKNNNAEKEPECSGLLRFNYSSLYDEELANDVLKASRDEDQLANAIKNIETKD